MTEGVVVDLASFRARAQQWIHANLPPARDEPVDAHELQRLLFDAGFAGIAFPEEYGGAGLTLEHQKAFFDAAAEAQRQVPAGTWVTVSIGMLGPTVLDHGSHAVKARFLPELLRGSETWIQLLSEPRGGSDMAGAHTRLTRDGDTYVLTGSKMWSTHAYDSTFGLCLARSDWHAPKHRGLSMIAVPLQGTPGLTIARTRAANGEVGDFCEEFFDDVRLPADNLVGEENQGWQVAQSLLFHERNAGAGIGYGYLGARSSRDSAGRYDGPDALDLLHVARRRGRARDGALRQLAADVYVDDVVLGLLSARIMTGMRLGTHQGPWGSLLKLQRATSGLRVAKTALAVGGADGVIWDGDDVDLERPGTRWLGARGMSLAGGSNEMQRNTVSERLLGLPREPAVDRDVPFSETLGARSGRRSTPSLEPPP
jgi:alkylation response protein AidB-like acyl-CoA dehydrogenase